MRILAALFTLLPVAAPAQSRGPGLPPPVAVRSAGALGGSYAGQGISRPLGGIAPPSYQSGARPAPTPTPNGGYRYYGPVYYVPNVIDVESADTSHSANAAYHPAHEPVQPASLGRATSAVQFSGVAPAAQPQTVIVNQYFGKDGPENTTKVSASTSAGEASVAREYYMIAYRNRNVVTALAYWLDGDTLHYVTAENAHNQSSLALIDLEMTTRLNADREVPFVAPGK